MTKPKKTLREKRLAREENGMDSSDDHDEFEIGVGSNTKMDVETMAQPMLDVNMVFVIPEEFRAPETEVTELCVGVERAVFERPAKPREHMKPMYIRGHLDSVPVSKMMVDGGASFNIMPTSLFDKLGLKDEDLKQTNMNLTGF
jgi:hypothetical protein